MDKPKYKVGDHVICLGFPEKSYNGHTGTIITYDEFDLSFPYYVEWHDLRFGFDSVGWMGEQFLHPVELIKERLYKALS
jgi:hypothetical protein